MSPRSSKSSPCNKLRSSSRGKWPRFPSHLLNTFEEITLLHRLTEHLSLSKSIVKLCELSVRWLVGRDPGQVRRDQA